MALSFQQPIPTSPTQASHMGRKLCWGLSRFSPFILLLIVPYRTPWRILALQEGAWPFIGRCYDTVTASADLPWVLPNCLETGEQSLWGHFVYLQCTHQVIAKGALGDETGRPSSCLQWVCWVMSIPCSELTLCSANLLSTLGTYSCGSWLLAGVSQWVILASS